MQRRRSLRPARRVKTGGREVGSRSIARSIAERTGDLAVLAAYIGCAGLAYMLKVATVEAEKMSAAPKAC